MRTNNKRFRKPLVLMAGLLLLASAGPAQEKEMAPEAPDAKSEPKPEPAKGFTFRVDPLVLGVVRAHVDTNSAKWEEYRDQSSGFVIPQLHLIGEGSGDRELDFNAVNLRRDDA